VKKTNVSDVAIRDRGGTKDAIKTPEYSAAHWHESRIGRLQQLLPVNECNRNVTPITLL
jgi:hypothetical protein